MFPILQKKRSIYLAIVRSQFEHCSTIWRPGTITSKDKLESIQRKGVKWIKNKVGLSRTHTSKSDYYKWCKELNLLSIDLRLEFNDLKMFYKIVTGRSVIKLPPYITCYSGTRLRSSHMDEYSLISNVHPRITINYSNSNDTSDDSDGLDQSTHSFLKFSNSYFYMTLISWNNLPLDIRKAENCKKIGDKLEKYLWTKFEEISNDEVQ